MTIDGVDYDLASGNLFLVRAGLVKQLCRDLGEMRLRPEYFRALATDDAEVRAFFTEGVKPG